MSDATLPFLTLSELSRQIAAGRLSPVELTQALLSRIEALNPRLNAFRLVTPERALAEAQAAELALAAGRDTGALHGIPYAAKDLFDVKGLTTTAGSSLLEGNVAASDSTATSALARAGMVLLGKTHTVQFAYGGVGINHDYGTPHNPWSATHCVPGGSSSGSGVAVAAGLAPAALGTDTGGSVRIPAALCGCVGLKTTVGQVSRAGVFPLSWSLDSVGPLTRSVEDSALLYQCLQGQDPRDPSTRGTRPQDVLTGLRDGVSGLRLAFAESVFWDDVHDEIAEAVRATERVFSELGARVTSLPFEEAKEALALNPRGLVIAAEAYVIHRHRIEKHLDRYDPIVAPRIMSGKDIPAWEYLNTTRAWQGLRVKARQTLRDVDALLVPTTAVPAQPLAEIDQGEVYFEQNLKHLRNTAIGNTLDLCALSVPCGFTRQGMPIGLMIYGKPCNEDLVLRIGYAYEQATEWHLRNPDLCFIS